MIDRRSRFVFFLFFFLREWRGASATVAVTLHFCFHCESCTRPVVSWSRSASQHVSVSLFFLRLSQICCSSLGLCLTLVRFFSSCSSSSFGRINAEVSQSVSFCISDQKVVSSNAETGRTPSTTWISFFLIWTIKTPHQVTLELNVCCCCCCSSHLDSLGLLWSEQRGSGSHLKTV